MAPGRVSPDTVQGVLSARRQQNGVQSLRLELTTECRTADDHTSRGLVDIRERGKRVHQRVAGEQRCISEPWEDVRPGAPAWNKVPFGVRVVPALAARGKVEQCAGLRRRLAHVTARAGGRLRGGGDAAELRANPHHSNRVVKELLPEVALRLSRLEERVRASIGQPWLRKIGIVRRNHQLLDSAHLLVDETAQLRGTVALSDRDCAAQQGNDHGHGSGPVSAARTAAGNLRALHRGGEMRETLRAELC